MTEEIKPDAGQTVPTQVKLKPKRDIIRFSGAVPTAINLEHVTSMSAKDNRVNFCFYTNSIDIDFESPEAAKQALEGILTLWSSHVVE